MFADQVMPAVNADGTLGPLPKSLPDVVLGYLNVLNRHREKDEPDDKAVQDAAKITAWWCVRDKFVPAPAPEAKLIASLAERRAPEGILDYLELKLRLIRKLGADHSELAFDLDPVAEYLGALHIVARNGGSTRDWEDFLRKAKTCQSANSIYGFLVAVQDCCLAANKDSLKWVIDEIGALLRSPIAKRETAVVV
jgi:hypothetical protein